MPLCNGPPAPHPLQTHFHRPCTVLLSFLLLRYIVSGSDLFAGHALCLWGEKLGAILAKQRSNQVTTHILLPSLLASITGGQIPCRSVSLRTRLLWYCWLTLSFIFYFNQKFTSVCFYILILFVHLFMRLPNLNLTRSKYYRLTGDLSAGNGS